MQLCHILTQWMYGGGLTECINLSAMEYIAEITIFIPPLNEIEEGYTGFTLSLRLSVCLSVCGQNRVCSVYFIILAGSISYLHILSISFRRCAVC